MGDCRESSAHKVLFHSRKGDSNVITVRTTNVSPTQNLPQNVRATYLSFCHGLEKNKKKSHTVRFLRIAQNGIVFVYRHFCNASGKGSMVGSFLHNVYRHI